MLTNVSDPVDLVITKADDGSEPVAGGPSFDYTITVDNLGPRDATGIDPVTVTDQLPVGLEFVSFPANCTAVGQTLTCDLSPADLQVADPPVVITVTVKAQPPMRPRHLHQHGLRRHRPTIRPASARVAFLSAAYQQQRCLRDHADHPPAGIGITKVDNVDGPITPGTTYSYFITVRNPGPSSFPSAT